MTGIPAHLLCRGHRGWEGIFIIETCLKVLARGPSVIAEMGLHGRFDLRLAQARMEEIRLLDGGPTHVRFPDMVAQIEKNFGVSRANFLGYIHPMQHIKHLRRVCFFCRSLIDNDARTAGRLYLPPYIRRVK
jgi:hypothetical protein